MIKLACPHCRIVGMVPELLSETGGWPIACHHCHQHYFAPVLSGPLPMARLIDLTCQKCGFVAQLDNKALDDLRVQNFTLFCPKCHDTLLIQPPSVTTSSSLPNAASELETNSMSVDRVISDAPQTAAIAQPELQRRTSINSGSVALLLVTGFLVSFIIIEAARNGIIDRTWLDVILEELPHPSKLREFVGGLTAKVAQLYH